MSAIATIAPVPPPTLAPKTLHAAFLALAEAMRASIDAQRATLAAQERIADVMEQLAVEQPSTGWLSIEETARLMGVASSTVRGLIADGKLRVVDVTGAAPRVPREAIEEFRRRRERRVRTIK